MLSAGLKRLAEGDIDAVLLDLGLPDSHGLSALIDVQEQAPDVPIVVLTGFDDTALANRAVRWGAEDYLVKGQVDGNSLVRSLRYAIERKKTQVMRLTHLNSILRAIRDINQLIVFEKDRYRLVRKACDILIKTRGYHNAWSFDR